MYDTKKENALLNKICKFLESSEENFSFEAGPKGTGRMIFIGEESFFLEVEEVEED